MMSVYNPQTEIRYYRLADAVMSVIADSASSEHLVEEMQRKYQLASVPSGNHLIAGSLEIYSGIAVPEVPENLQRDDVEGGICRTDGKSLWLDIEESRIYLSAPPQNQVRVWTGSSAKVPQASAIIAAGAYALPSLLRRSERYEMHAAGLLDPVTQRGVLVLGDSGSGKSTLTLRLVQSGWHYLSDDQLLLRADADLVSAWGLRRVFSLTPQTMEVCDVPGLSVKVRAASVTDSVSATHSSVTKTDDKYSFDPQQLFADQNVPSCVPDTLIFTRLTNEKQSRSEPVRQADAMLGLIRQSPWICYDPVTAQRHTQALTQLAKQCQAFVIYAGCDLLEQPQRAETLLRTVLSE